MDAEGYRAKRRNPSALASSGRQGDKYRKNMTLKPNERLRAPCDHTALRDYKGVTTYSTGVEPNRRTVVAYPHQK